MEGREQRFLKKDAVGNSLYFLSHNFLVWEADTVVFNLRCFCEPGTGVRGCLRNSGQARTVLFSFSRNLHPVLHNACTSSHSHHQYDDLFLPLLSFLSRISIYWVPSTPYVFWNPRGFWHGLLNPEYCESIQSWNQVPACFYQSRCNLGRWPKMVAAS